MIYVLDYTYD